MKGDINPSQSKAVFFASYDPSQSLSKARLSLERTKGADFGWWTCRLKFSPAKAGPEGLLKLTSAIEAIAPFANVKKLIASFRISRLDAAVDCIGASPLDLIAHVPKPGKRMVFVGAHGRPETVYHFALKKPFATPPQSYGVRTYGPNRLTLYERRDFHLQLALQPPYGEAPVTRAEVTKSWKKGRPALADLAEIPALFEGRRVAYAAAIAGVGGSRRWVQFCLAAFGGGVNKAFTAWLTRSGGKFAAAYQNCIGDLVDETCWERWEDGLDYTGLTEWIEIAKKHG